MTYLMSEDQRVLNLLRALDRQPGPDHLEFPQDYDHPRARTLLAALTQRLGEDFGHPCTVDEHVQDAAFHATVTVPAEATEAGTSVAIRMSNFGDLTTAWTGTGDDLDEAVTRGTLSQPDRHRIESALTGTGCVLVPRSLLHHPYDGATALATFHPDSEPTWWNRFFDHL